MKAIILNSGVGSRMGKWTENSPKCLLPLGEGHTVLSRQIDALIEADIRDFIITTGQFHDAIQEYVEKRYSDVDMFRFVQNGKYNETNYIYSMYLIRELIDDDCFLLHGDLVYDASIARSLLSSVDANEVLVSPGDELPEKDFKGRIEENRVREIGIDIFEHCKFLLPFYKLDQEMMKDWMERIEQFVMRGEVSVYAENALNGLLQSEGALVPHYFNGFCREIDTVEDYDVCLSRIESQGNSGSA